MNTRSAVQHAFGTVTGTTITVLSAANFIAVFPASYRWAIYRLAVTVGAAPGTLTIQDTVPTSLSQAFQLAANGSIVLDMPVNGDFWWQTANPGTGIQFTMSASTTVGFDVWWNGML
jgi:hypothetical protein